MADKRAKHLSKLVGQLLVPAGATVSLAKDYDPAFKAGWLSKQESEQQLAATVDLLAEYQERLAAQDTPACWSCCRESTRQARTARSGT